MGTNEDRWAKCGRKPDKVITEIRRACREKNIPLDERQNGSSHWVGKTPKGSVVVARHGEIPKGTWGSIWRMLVGLGIAALLIAVLLIASMTVQAASARYYCPGQEPWMMDGAAPLDFDDFIPAKGCTWLPMVVR